MPTDATASLAVLLKSPHRLARVGVLFAVDAREVKVRTEAEILDITSAVLRETGGDRGWKLLKKLFEERRAPHFLNFVKIAVEAACAVHVTLPDMRVRILAAVFQALSAEAAAAVGAAARESEAAIEVHKDLPAARTREREYVFDDIRP